jgi:hypothetical protein
MMKAPPIDKIFAIYGINLKTETCYFFKKNDSPNPVTSLALDPDVCITTDHLWHVDCDWLVAVAAAADYLHHQGQSSKLQMRRRYRIRDQGHASELPQGKEAFG